MQEMNPEENPVTPEATPGEGEAAPEAPVTPGTPEEGSGPAAA